MTPQTVQTPSTSRPRRRVAVFGALLVAATLVGTGAFMAIPDPSDAAGSEGLSQDQSLASPEAVLAEANRVLPVLAAGDASAATETVADAQATLDAAAQDAQATLLAEAAAQEAAVRSAAGTTGVLPTVPTGWVPGSDVTRFVGPVGSTPYGVPLVRVPTNVGGATTVVDQTVGGSFATGPGVVPTDGLGDIFATIDSLGLPPLPAGLGDALPVPQGQDAGAVDPDDEGAQNALVFGYQVTDGVTGVLGDLDAQADGVLATHAGLVSQVEARAAEARAAEAQGAAAIDAELKQRLADADAATQARIDALATARESHAAAVEAAVADAEAALDAQAAAAQADLEATAQQQADALVRAASDAAADAEARSAAVDARAQSYLALLADMQASGDDVTGQVAAVQAEAARLQAEIQADAEAQQATLLSAAEELQAQAEAHAADLQTARADVSGLQASADEAVAGVERMVAFGEAVATARHAAVAQVHTEAAKQATADLRAQADAQVEDVRRSAEAYLAASEAFAAQGTAIVERVQADGDAHVDLAADYVRKVAEDYATVPEPERQATAEQLLAEAETLSTIGLGVVASGESVAKQFAAVAQSSADLRGQVAALPL